MKETRFIAQNKEKWQESEHLLKQRNKDPEKLTSLFTQVIDDLSYSRTFYPNRSVRVYLNKIGREYFSIIYNRRGAKKNYLKQFWLDELPQIVLHAKNQILISLAIFVLAASIGIFSSVHDPQFTTTILGEDYVAMTKENIENGDPMAVYKKGHQVDMFLGITLNNLMVAFRTYVFGVFLSIGTIAILLYNGIMVGCFQFFFIEKGLFAESALTIWLHGTLEISSIILAGGAGLTLGSGLIFPGTYSRLQAFQISAIRSLKLMLGITPIFVFAAIIESFITRYTEVPDIVRLFLILLSLFFIVGYFAVYPWLKSRKGFDHPLEEIRLPVTVTENVNFDKIKNNAELIKDTFLYYKKYGYKLLPWITAATIIATTADFIASDERGSMLYIGMWWQYLFNDLFYALKTPSLAYVFINAAGSALVIFKAMVLLDGEFQKSPTNSFLSFTFLQTALLMFVMYGIFYALDEWGVIIFALIFLCFLLTGFVQLTHRTNIFTSISKTWELATEKFGQIAGLQLILILITFSFLLLLSTPLLYMNIQILEWNFVKTDIWAQKIIEYITKFIRIFAFHMILPILAACTGYLYFSLKEIVTAEHLKKSISLVGSKTLKERKR